MSSSVVLVALPSHARRRAAEALRGLGIAVAAVEGLGEMGAFRPDVAVVDGGRVPPGTARATAASGTPLVALTEDEPAAGRFRAAGVPAGPVGQVVELVLGILEARDRPGGVLALSDRLVDLRNGSVRGPGDATTGLGPTEVALLAVLAEADGEPVDRETLLVRAWGASPDLVTRAVDHAVGRLRPKLEADPGSPRHLLTVRGVGYRLRAVRRRPVEELRGRAAEVAALRQALATGKPEVRVVGLAGIGKSELVQSVLPLADAWLTAPGPVPDRGLVVVDAVDELVLPELEGRQVVRIARSGAGDVRIGPLPVDAARWLLRQGLAQRGVTWSDGEVDRAVWASGAIPGLLLMVAELAELAPADRLLPRLVEDPVATLYSAVSSPDRCDLDALYGGPLGALSAGALDALGQLDRPLAAGALGAGALSELEYHQLVGATGDHCGTNWVVAPRPLVLMARERVARDTVRQSARMANGTS